MKKIVLFLVMVFVPSLAAAQIVQQYALELSAPCSMTVYDTQGHPQANITEPTGYVVEYQWWQGAAADAAQGNAMTPPDPSFSTLYQATDPCGHAWNPVLVVGGVPADGSGGVTLP